MITRLFKSLLRQLFVRFKQFVGRSDTVKGLLYESRNQGIFSDLFAHERMLADRIRVEAYRSGIARCVKPGDVVIDLGTGTGILAYFALQSGASRVYAIDHSGFIEVARQIAAHNGFDKVEFIQKHSSEFVPPERADVLIHEQIGRNLFGENMIKNLLDLKSRALKPGGRIVPGAFELFIEPVALKKEHRVPRIWEFKDLGFGLEFLKGSPLLEQHKRRDYGLFRIQTHFVDFLLCEPEALIEFDINTMTSPAEISQRFEVSRTVLREGILDGFCIYFRAKFDAQTVIDSSPMMPQTHWENLVIRTERQPYTVGERIAYTVELPSLTSAISWKVSLVSSQ